MPDESQESLNNNEPLLAIHGGQKSRLIWIAIKKIKTIYVNHAIDQMRLQIYLLRIEI